MTPNDTAFPNPIPEYEPAEFRDPAYYDLDRMLSVSDVMCLLGISRGYLHVLVKRGELRPMRFARGVRYRRGDVVSYCRARMQGGEDVK